MKTPSFGAYPSGSDYRDHVAAASAIPITPNFTLPAKLPKTFLGGVLDQNLEPDCVLFATVKLMKLFHFMQTGQWVDLSPRFLAILIKRYDGQDRATGGTFPRLAMKLAAQYGCCTTKLLPNDSSLPVLTYREDDLLTQVMFDEALQYRIPGFVGVEVDFNKTREGLYLYKALSTLFQVGNELWTPDWNKKHIDPMRTPKAIVSGHQMVQNGWNDNVYNYVENQWSEDWADAGSNQFDYKAWMPFIMEQWAVAKIPADVQQFLKNLPSPLNFHYVWSTNLALGDHNKDVQFAQIALMILGLLAPVAPDELGFYGSKTAAAVAKFQASKGIYPTAPNNIGSLTRAALNKTFSI